MKNIQALEDLSQGEYDKVGEAYQNMHPRIYHRTFSNFYNKAVPAARVDSEALEDMQEILSDRQDEDHFWLEDKLFRIGYTLGPKEDRRSRRRKKRQRENPDLPHGEDMMPDMDLPMPDSPVRRGREKREADDYYRRASTELNIRLNNMDVDIV